MNPWVQWNMAVFERYLLLEIYPVFIFFTSMIMEGRVFVRFLGITLPETNIFAPKNGWLEYDDRFLFGILPIFRGVCC